MAWMMSGPQVHNTLGSLGVLQGDTYNVNDDCLNILEEILRKLAIEDQTLRTFRRAIGFGQNIRKDLIPLLIYVKDDTKICDATKIIDTTIKILVNLTVPVECLLSIEAVSRTDVGRHTIFELNKLLSTSKEAFTDSRSTKAVVDHMKHMVEKDSNLNVEQCDSINNCLLLLRNILHIPETRSSISNCTLTHSGMQNEIIWNIFTQSIDKIIIYLMSCPQKTCWGVTIVQLIALMYKDQHVGTLQKLLNIWLETTLSESSEDNESNTSPPDEESGDSSPIITSDPTSDSSDNGGNHRNKNNINITETMRNKSNTVDVVRTAQNRSKSLIGIKRNKSTETETSTSSGISSMGQSMDSNCSIKTLGQQSPTLSDKFDTTSQQSNNTINNSAQTKKLGPSTQSEISDCGYGTQVENPESISTSSNEDDQPHKKPVYQKPHIYQKCRYTNQKTRPATIIDKKELRRKKLVKRSKTNIINMKGLMHHTPTDEDITNILKEFTVDFLLKGYGNLVHDLHSQLLTNLQVPIDTSHFFWLVTYFLKFATQLELDMEHIRSVLSYDIISYLIFQGVWLYEELEISCKMPDVDLKPCLRRLHLVVTALREFLQAVEMYQKLSHLSNDDKEALNKLQKQIRQTKDLRQLFLLLLRQHNPILHSRQYLQDLILTNHNYLLCLENISSLENYSINLMEHLQQFATVEIMRQYGLLLENFTENGEFVNNCVFTMMHHVGGDLEHISALFQPSILKTFSQIWETDYEICDDWSDLIEYVIHKFINSPRTNPCSSITSPLTPLLNDSEENLSIPLVSPSSKSSKENRYDTMMDLSKKYKEIGKSAKPHQAIIKELLEQSINSQALFDDFMKMSCSDNKELVNGNMNMLSFPLPSEILANGDIKVLIEHLYRDNRESYIYWLKSVVLEACFVKLALTNQELFKSTKSIMEPSVYYYALLHLPIPIVPWTSEQFNSLKHQPFILLLHKLGFCLPTDTGKLFLRIPNFWTADYLFSIAQQLGPIESDTLKFDISLLEGRQKTEFKSEAFNAISNNNGPRRFSLTELRNTPSLVRYTPPPNSTDWVHTNLQSKSTSEPALPINHKLSIRIPDIDSLPCNIPPPKLSLAKNRDCESPLELLQHSTDMDISPSDEDSSQSSNDDRSDDETESVASDLTRMCVSDEEDKVVFINHQDNI